MRVFADSHLEPQKKSMVEVTPLSKTQVRNITQHTAFLSSNGFQSPCCRTVDVDARIKAEWTSGEDWLGSLALRMQS